MKIKSFYRRLFDEMLAEWPEQVRQPLIRYHLRSIWTGLGLREGKNVDTTVRAELIEGGALPTIPMIVVPRTGSIGSRRRSWRSPTCTSSTR